jgi:1-acyl-sn-glycerol-3-phosphate acyltransferase
MQQNELSMRSAGVSPLKTLLDHIVVYSSLVLLGSICLAWSLIALPLYLVLPRRLGTIIGRFGIMAGFRLYALSLTAMGAYRLDLSALDALRDESRLILAPNHPSLIDALLILTRHRNMVCVMKSELARSVFLGPGSRLARYIRNDSARLMIKGAIEQLRGGCVLMLFPEGTRTVNVPINRCTASIGIIAKHAQVPVQTLIIETDSPYLAKGSPLLRAPILPITYRIRLGRRFEPPTDTAQFARELEQYYAAELGSALQTRWLSLQTPAEGVRVQ